VVSEWVVESDSPEQTEAAGAGVAAALEPGDVVAVRGDLGAGKTVFVRGACRALGVRERVTSPTYTVGHSYAAAAAAVSHLDLYRSSGLTGDEWGDLEPYFDGAICFVEWPEAGETVLPPARLRVTIEIGAGDGRLITMRTSDPRLAGALGHPCT